VARPEVLAFKEFGGVVPTLQLPGVLLTELRLNVVPPKAGRPNSSLNSMFVLWAFVLILFML
jgi:hypothetical protein